MFRHFTDRPKTRLAKSQPINWHNPVTPMASYTVCVVSDLARTGATTSSQIARLMALGWRVTVLDTAAPDKPDHPYDGAIYQRLTGLYQETNWYIEMQSLTAYHWLRAQTFDLIIFHTGFAAGYYSAMARRLNLAFAQTPLIIWANDTHAGQLERCLNFPSGRHDFEIDFMERKTAELADGLITALPVTVDDLSDNGWALPAKAAVFSDDIKAASCASWLEKFITDALIAQPAKTKPVFISVCIASYNRPDGLREALASLAVQSVTQFDVTVMDDGSTDPAVDALRDELRPIFQQRGWHWQRQNNTGPATARNNAARQARGDYLLFMDDDDIAYPDQIERFALAAQQGGDVIGCILGLHPGCENGFPPTAHLPEPTGAATRPVGWTPIGGDLALTAFINVAGYAHALYQRKKFLKLGGFAAGKDVVFEDFDFLIRALIAGYRIDIVPEILMLYRRTRQSRSMGQDIFAGHLSTLKHLARLMPPALRGLLLPLRQEWYARHRRRRDGEL